MKSNQLRSPGDPQRVMGCLWIIGGFCELVRNIYGFLWRPTPLKSQVREKMGTHYSPGDLGGEEDRHLPHSPSIFTVNPLDSLGRTLPRCKGPSKMNRAGLRSGGWGWGGAHPCALEFLGATVICIQLRKRLGGS